MADGSYGNLGRWGFPDPARKNSVDDLMRALGIEPAMSGGVATQQQDLRAPLLTAIGEVVMNARPATESQVPDPFVQDEELRRQQEALGGLEGRRKAMLSDTTARARGW